VIERISPLLGLLRSPERPNVRADVAAGLTVGVMLIPQGMAYALIAGLPPIYGLYAALVPLAVYAALGSSRQLAVGPVAMVSLLVAAGVAPLAEGSPSRYVELALTLALLVGVIQLLLGLFRFGFVVNFLSHPVLTGFTSAAALIIGFSQLKNLTGIDLARSHHIHEIALVALGRIAEIHAVTIAIGLLSIGFLLVLRARWPRLPGALLLVVVMTGASALLGLEGRGVAVVGTVPSGLPGFALPGIVPADLRALLPTALAISLVGFMESIAVAQVYAARRRYTLDANQELIALGAANVVGSAFQSYPVTGGFSRTAVNAEAGAQSQMASLISAGVIAVTVLFLTPLFRALPNPVLAAIVVVAVSGLVDIKAMRELWRVDRRDLALLVITFLATLTLGIERGIMVGVMLSVLVVMHLSSRPHSAVLGRLPDTDVFRNVDRFPEAQVPHGIVIFRVDASLYFANASFVRAQVVARVDEAPGTRAVVLDASAVNRVDSTGVHALEALALDLADRGVSLHPCGLKGPVRDVLARAHALEHMGPKFRDIAEALEALSPDVEGLAPGQTRFTEGPDSHGADADPSPLVRQD
jgi:SulP family sulfate permease